jgi:hypothetical protein
MAEHVVVSHSAVESQALVPAAALAHYESRGWKKVEGDEAAAMAAAASEPVAGEAVVSADSTELASLTKEALLEVARSRGMEAAASSTKADLLRRLESA